MSQTPRSVGDLFRQYLQRQIAAHADGLGVSDPDGQVVPHEAVPVQPVDPRRAWENALAVAQHLTTERTQPRWQVPPDWPALVAGQEPAVSLAFCVGNYPQMVRNLQPLLHGGDLATLRQTRSLPSIVSPALLEWAKAARGFPQVFLGAAMLRLARHFDEANDLLNSLGKVPADWQAFWANEVAALAWHRGQVEEARASWRNQKTSVPVLFNRGMAALFVGDFAEAQSALTEAIAQVPETSSWHHLGHLYLTLSTARGGA
jgi:hypothetical protein